MKAATKVSLRDKKILKTLNFQANFLRECNQKNRSACNKFGVTISCLATCFLGVGAHFSLKVTTKASLRGEKILKILIFRLFF